MTDKDVVLIGEAALRALGVKAFMGLGLREADAADVCSILLLADLFGLSTHGFSRVESYGERLLSGGIRARPGIGIERLAPSLIAAEAGFVSIIGSNATTTIAPWGGTDARLGNSPLGFGVPNPGGQPFLLDMAMSVVARAKIRTAARRGESIPEAWATDAAGLPTTDPRAALDGFLLPIGGHKGYGLALMVDLLSGLLANAAYLTHVKSWVDSPDEPQNLGHFFILIDSSRLGSSQWLSERMRDFAQILHDSPPARSDTPVIVPGEIELDRMTRQRREGLRMPREVIDLMQSHAARLDAR
jgi:LDH2 family malate/lactate/ureidoglycolate dehydrogenase